MLIINKLLDVVWVILILVVAYVSEDIYQALAVAMIPIVVRNDANYAVRISLCGITLTLFALCIENFWAGIGLGLICMVGYHYAFREWNSLLSVMKTVVIGNTTDIVDSEVYDSRMKYTHAVHQYGLAPLQLNYKGIPHEVVRMDLIRAGDDVDSSLDKNTVRIYCHENSLPHHYVLTRHTVDQDRSIDELIDDRVVMDYSVDNPKVPKLGSSGAGAIDLYTHSYIYYPSDQRLEINTGIAVEIPSGHVGLLIPRSSTSKLGIMMANNVGVIDSDYRGPIVGIFHDINPEWNIAERISVGDRHVQLIVVPIFSNGIKFASSLSPTVRGTGGWGSTGS